MRSLPTLCLIAALALAVPARAQEASDEAHRLAAALAGVRDAAPADRDGLLDALISKKPTVADLVWAVEAGLPAPETTAGWQVLEATDSEGAVRKYHLYVPEKVAESRATAPLMVDMHGGVGRAEFIPDEQFARFRDAWKEMADEHGVVLALPLGRRDCMWWIPAGVRHVRATIRDARRHAPIDSDRIFATGFSDGGSGAYLLAMAAPDPFAGLLPMNGHPAVAIGNAGHQLYPANTRLTPLFVAMTQDDSLYPANSVLPHIQAFFDLGAKVHLVSYPTGGHRPVYWEDQMTAFTSFVNETERGPLPKRVRWFASDPAAGAVRWVEMLELGAGRDDVELDPEQEVMSRPGRVVLGFGIAQDGPETGVGVGDVRAKSTAEGMGLEQGDAIVAIDGKPTPDVSALRGILGDKHHGDSITVTVRRGGSTEPIELSAELPPFTPEPSYPRTQPTAYLDVARDGNTVVVRSRHVRRFRLLLSPTEFDLNEEIVVQSGGEEIVRRKVQVSVERLLRRFADQADERRLFAAELEVELPAAEAK